MAMEGAAERDPGGNGHGDSILPLKKRALNDSNGGRGSGSGDAYAPSPKKRRELHGCVGVESQDAGPASSSASPGAGAKPVDGCENKGSGAGGEASIPRVSSAAASTEPAAKGGVLSARLNTLPVKAKAMWSEKQKWKAPKVETSSDSESDDAPHPPAEKLMGDAIRSSATAAAAAKRKQSDAGLGEKLRRLLDELGATPPWLLFKKPLQMSDVHPNQNRLLVSCKRAQEECPLTPCFSDAELQLVENKEVGLLVTALDSDGVSYVLTCKFLNSNRGYRFISPGWKEFLRRNRLVVDAHGRWTRDVDLEVRVFRSHALRRQRPLENGKLAVSRDENGKVDQKASMELEIDHHLHPEGGLGLILLHHEHKRKRRVQHEDDDGDEEGPSSPPVSRGKSKKRRVQPEEEDGDEAGPSSRPVSRGESKREEQHDAKPAAASPVAPREALATISKDEMVARFGEQRSNAAIGLLMVGGIIMPKALPSVIPKEEQDGIIPKVLPAIIPKEEEQDQDFAESTHA